MGTGEPLAPTPDRDPCDGELKITIFRKFRAFGGACCGDNEDENFDIHQVTISPRTTQQPVKSGPVLPVKYEPISAGESEISSTTESSVVDPDAWL